MKDQSSYQRIVCKRPLPFFYISLSVEFAEYYRKVDAISFKRCIMMAMKEMFGEVGASAQIDVLKYTEEDKSAIIRVDSRTYVKLRSALMLCGGFLESKDPCAFRIHQVSQHLIALSDCSRKQ